MTPTTNWHMDAIKKHSFRGNYTYDDVKLLIKIKVSSKRSKTVLEEYFANNGISGFKNEISLLGWFECWEPRYQIID